MKLKTHIPISKELFEHTDTQQFLKNSKLCEGMLISIVDSRRNNNYICLEDNNKIWANTEHHQTSEYYVRD